MTKNIFKPIIIASTVGVLFAGCKSDNQQTANSSNNDTEEQIQVMENEYTHDVVVIGAGGAGFAAAVEAADSSR